MVPHIRLSNLISWLQAMIPSISLSLSPCKVRQRGTFVRLWKAWIFSRNGPFYTGNFLNLTQIVQYKTDFNWGSKGIWDCLGFTLFRLVIGLKKNSHHRPKQSDARPIVRWSSAFTRATSRILNFPVLFSLFWWAGERTLVWILRHLNEKRSIT